MKARPYQREAINALEAFWDKRPMDWPLIVLPTAAGKTVVFCIMLRELFAQFPKLRVLILAHRKELITQAENKLKTIWPDAPVGVYSAGLNRREGFMRIVIASRDTIAGKINAVGRFDIVLVDEAHNIAPKEASRYRRIIRDLQRMVKNLMVVGFTATPFRAGMGYIFGKEKEKLFDAIAYEARIRPLMDAGYLSKITAKAVDLDAVADTSQIKTVAGDFQKKELGAAVTDNKLIVAAINDWERKAVHNGRRSTLFFAVSVAHADLINQELQGRGYRATIITGTTPTPLRDKAVELFSRGKLDALVNVGVFTEGTDIPRIDCIALLRPTKSLGLYIQMVGRGLRVHPDKENTLVLDYGENIARFGPIDIAQPAPPRAKDDRTKVCPVCFEMCGFLKRVCPECGFRFEPEPVKLCPECGEENAPSAKVCCACGYLFASHEMQAYQGEIISSRDGLVKYRVNNIGFIPFKAHGYIVFQCEGGVEFKHKIMIGKPGYTGKKALRDLSRVIAPGLLLTHIKNLYARPQLANAYKISEAISKTLNPFRPLFAIVVKTTGKHPKVMRFIETDDEEIAA